MNEKHTHNRKKCNCDWNSLLVVVLVTTIRPLRPYTTFISYGVWFFLSHPDDVPREFSSILLCTYSSIQNEIILSWIHFVSFVRSPEKSRSSTLNIFFANAKHKKHECANSNWSRNYRMEDASTLCPHIICFLC